MSRLAIVLTLLVAGLGAQKILDATKPLDFDINKYFQALPNKLDLGRVDSAFSDFAKAYSKYYLYPGEKDARKQIFADSVANILLHNNEADSSFKMAVNQFSDLTFEEFKKKFLARNLEKEINKDLERLGRKKAPTSRLLDRQGKKGRHHHHRHGHHGHHDHHDHHHDHHDHARRLQALGLPMQVDWKSHVGPIKDQRNCAGCYAFSAVAGFEAMRSITQGDKTSYSEQSMIDCVKDNKGCISGTPGRVLDYIYDKGVARNSNYPFISKTGVCQKDAMKRGKVVKDAIDYSYLDAGILNLLQALKEGPVIIVHTVSAAFRAYRSGILDDSRCTDELDHSTLAVGFDLSAPKPFITVRNSWGTGWGEGGYFRLAIGALTNSNTGLCKIAAHDYNLELYM